MVEALVALLGLLIATVGFALGYLWATSPGT